MTVTGSMSRSFSLGSYGAESADPHNSPSRCMEQFQTKFREIEWDVAISWQLQNLRGCFGVYVAVTGSIPGGPIKTEQLIQSIFHNFALISSYLFSPCWIEHLFLITITPRSSNLVENFLFYE